MSVKDLPSYIHVANFKDIFWNNNSDLYPTNTPKLILYTRIEKQRPTFYSPYVGTCILKGEFNHAVFNDVYYFLTKLEVIDIKERIYKYQLDYDVICNLLYKGCEIKGVLTKTNDPEILEDCLQTTIPILSDPQKIKKFSFKNITETEWQKRIQIFEWNRALIEKMLVGVGITVKNFEEFVYKINNNPIGKLSKDKEWRCNKFQTSYYDPYQSVDPLFILDWIPLTINIHKWKLLILNKLKDFLNDKEKFVLVTHNDVSHFNNGKLVLSIKDKGAGGAINESKQLSSIDLSELSDLVIIDNKTGTPIEQNVTPDYNHLGISDFAREEVPKILLWLGREAYLPTEKTPFNNPFDGNYYYQQGKTNWNSLQKITFKNNDVGYQWYLDKNNIPLVNKEWGFATTKFHESDHFSHKLVNFSSQNDHSHYTWWPFYELPYDKIPPLGFIIFQLDKSPISWRGITYISDVPIKKIRYRSGLEVQSDVEYRFVTNAKVKWWVYTSKDLKTINQSSLLSTINLDVDLFSWFTIAPSYKDLEYKYFYNNSWGYQSLFPDAGSREIWYPSRIQHLDIGSGARKLKNPYNISTIDSWLLQRYNTLKKISIYSDVELEKQIQKGDIFVSTLEYKIKIPSFGLQTIPFDFTFQEIEQLQQQIGLLHLPEEKYSQLESHVREQLQKHFNKLVHGIDEDDPYTTHKFFGRFIAKEIATLGLWTIGEAISYQIHLKPIKNVLDNFSLYGKDSVKYTYGLTEEQYIDNIQKISPISLDETYKSKEFLNNCVVFYLYRGEYRLGLFNQFSQKLELNNSNHQKVQSVDDVHYKECDFIHIKPFGNPIDYKNDTPLDDILKKEILIKGVCAAEKSQSDKIFDLTEDMLKKGTYTIDLVGTNWYLLCNQDTYHLIPKNSQVFSDKGSEMHNVEIEDKNISTYAKINQKAELDYFGQIIPLNTKFKFNKDRFNCYILPVDPLSGFHNLEIEYKKLLITEPHDYINTWIEIPKKQTTFLNAVDPAQILILQEKLAQLTTNYEQEKYKNTLMLDTKKTQMSRQREDLDVQYWKSAVGIGTQAITTGIGVGLAASGGGALGAMAGATTAMSGLSGMAGNIEFLIRYPTFMKRVNEDERNLILSNTQELYQRKQNYEHDFKIQTLKLNKLTNTFIRPSVTKRDIQESYNAQRGFTNINLHIYLPNQTQLEQISYIYNTYGCECISDKFVKEPLVIRDGMVEGLYQFSKIENDGLVSELTNDLTIKNIIRQIFQNGVKFSNTTHIPQQEDVVEIKVKKGTKLNFDTSDVDQWAREKWDVYKATVPKNKILEKIKGLKNYGLTDEEYAKYKDQIRTEHDDDLLDDINKIIHNRETGITVEIGSDVDLSEHEKIKRERDKLLNKQTDLEKQISDCKDEISKQKAGYAVLVGVKDHLEKEILEKQQELEKCEQDKLEVKNRLEQEIQKKIKEYETLQTKYDEDIKTHETGSKIMADVKKELEKKISDLEFDVSTLQEEKTDLTEQLKQCEINYQNVFNAKNTCDLINTKKIKELEAKIKQLEDEIKDKQIEIDAAKQGLSASTARVTESAEQLAKAQEQLTNLRNEINRLMADLAKKAIELQGKEDLITKDKAELEKQIQAANAKEAIIKIQEEQIKTYKEQEEKTKQAIIATENAFNDRMSKKQAELDACLKEKTSLQNRLNTVHDEKQTLSCEDISKLVYEKYNLDVGLREDGNSNFSDLVFELADSIRLMKLARLDINLPYPELRPVFKIMEGDLSFYPIIDAAQDLLNNPHYGGYERWLKGEGQWSDEYAPIVQEHNKFKEMLVNKSGDPDRPFDASVVLGLKPILDELNWLAKKAHDELEEHLQTDEFLQHFFTHTYPGKTGELYKKVYGVDPEIGIVRKRFINEGCQNIGEEGILKIREWIKNTSQTPSVISKETSKIPPTAPLFDTRFLDPKNILYFLEPHAEGAEYEEHWRQDRWNSYTDKGYGYDFDGHKYVWSEVYDTLAYNKHKTEFYVRTSYRQEDLQAVYDARNKLWQNRDKIVLPQDIKDALASGRYMRGIQVRNFTRAKWDATRDWDAKSNSYLEYTLDNKTFNHVQMFGKKAEDAIKLIAILDANKMWWEKEKIYESGSYKLQCYRVCVRKIDDPKKVLDSYITDPTRWWNISGDQEFKDAFAFLSYVYKHVSTNAPNLENTYNNLNKKFKWYGKLNAWQVGSDKYGT